MRKRGKTGESVLLQREKFYPDPRRMEVRQCKINGNLVRQDGSARKPRRSYMMLSAIIVVEKTGEDVH